MHLRAGTKRRLNAALLAFLLVLLSGAGPVLVWASTPTPSLTPSLTLTPSPTLNNTQIIVAATLAPPQTCGTIYMPCGPLPWNVPFFATVVLPSPTIRPTLPSPTPVPVTATPSQTFTPSFTPTAGAGTFTITPTPAIDVSSIQTQIAGQQAEINTLQAMGTVQVGGLNGTPVDMNGASTILATFISPMVSNMKGVTGAASNSRTGSLISFLALVLGFVILVMLVTMLFPVIVNIIRLVLQIVQTVIP